MYRILLLSLFILLTGCSSNWAFYAPSDKQSRALSDYQYPMQNLLIKSQSGNLLDVQLHFSTSRTPRGVVMHFHGNRGNISETFEKVEWLLDEGFDVLVFDYSGYGQSNGKPDPKVTYLDARSMLNIFSQLPPRSPDYKKIVWGTSLGGAILLSGLSEPGAKLSLDLMIIDSSFYSYSDTAVHVVSQHPLGKLITWLPKIFVDDHYAPQRFLGDLPDAPILISHCETDSLIPIEFSEQLYHKSSGQKTFWRLPGCAHARSFANENHQNQSLLLQVLNKPSKIAPNYTYQAARRELNETLVASRYSQ